MLALDGAYLVGTEPPVFPCIAPPDEAELQALVERTLGGDPDPSDATSGVVFRIEPAAPVPASRGTDQRVRSPCCNASTIACARECTPSFSKMRVT
jgi:hypothetical protein